jgi:serine/threonine-protein kinase HipA
MPERLIYVSIELQGENHLVGKLWSHTYKGHESASFQYEDNWLRNINKFALEPQLLLTEGSFHTNPGKSIFGSIGDSAPDRWGRVLMRRANFLKSQKDKITPRSMSEIDYLLGVNDESRIGALRFSTEPNGPYLSSTNTRSIPPLIELPKLLSASDNFTKNEEDEDDLKLLLAPGSSLGGARPKASIKDNNKKLAIAKFPRHDDEYSVTLWEALALSIAKLAEIPTPNWRIENITNKPVLIIKRFDRNKLGRVPFISAMSMLGANDNEHHSYLEIVDAIRQFGANPTNDITNLWKRIVFNILISNTDDHLRNHGFLFKSTEGWSLSPMYDVNPTPTSIKPRSLTTAIDFENTTASLELALSVAGEFNLTQSQAKQIAKQVANAVKQWRQIAKKLNIKPKELEYMASAFEHKDLKLALT